MKKIVKQDMNFLENPIWATDPQDKRNSYEIELPTGLFTFFCDPELIPNDKDALFLYYFLHQLQILSGYGNQSKKLAVTINRAEMFKDLNIKASSYSYKRLEKTLEAWGKVYLTFENSFYEVRENKDNDKPEKVRTRKTKSFHILKSKNIYEEVTRVVKGDEKIIKRGNIKIIFDEDFVKAIDDSKFFQLLDLQVFASLKKPVARRLLEWLPKQFLRKSEVEQTAEKVFLKCRIKGKPVPSVVERKLKVVKNSLEEINKYEKNYIYSCETKACKKNRKCTLFVFTRKLLPQKLESPLFDPINEESLLKLVKGSERRKKGIRSLIRNKIKKYEYEFLAKNIIYANNNSNKNGKYQGFLLSAIDGNWGVDTEIMYSIKYDYKDGDIYLYKGKRCIVDGGNLYTHDEEDIRKGIYPKTVLHEVEFKKAIHDNSAIKE